MSQQLWRPSAAWASIGGLLGLLLSASCQPGGGTVPPPAAPAGLSGFSGLVSSPLPAVSLGAPGEKRPFAEVYRRPYELTTDWFTPNLPIWEKALAPYKGRPGLRYLEVGTYEGGSLLWMLENVLTDPGARATAIDPFEGGPGEGYRSRFEENLRRAGAVDRVTVIKGYSQVELRQQPLASYDIVYVDGSHAAADVLEDAVLCWRLLKPGGLLIFDDYAWRPGSPDPAEWPGPGILAFHTFFGRHLEPVHVGYQLMLRRKADAVTAPFPRLGGR